MLFIFFIFKKHQEDLEAKKNEYQTLQKKSEELETQINKLREKKVGTTCFILVSGLFLLSTAVDIRLW